MCFTLVPFNRRRYLFYTLCNISMAFKMNESNHWSIMTKLIILFFWKLPNKFYVGSLSLSLYGHSKQRWWKFSCQYTWNMKFDFYLAKMLPSFYQMNLEWIIMGTIDDDDDDGGWQELKENVHLENGFYPLRFTLHAYVPEIWIKCWIEEM